MRIVIGRKVEELTGGALRARIDGRRVTLDIGAGDGAFAYRYARAHADRFVIALDPVAENMREASAKAARKPARGGAENVVFAVASAERAPDELRGLADEIFVTLPWGSLMRGLILGDEDVLNGIARMARDGATVTIVLNTRIFEDPVPVDARDLPELSPEYARATLAPRYAAHGIEIERAEWVDADAFGALETTWAKRLAHRRAPRSLGIVARVAGRPAD